MSTKSFVDKSQQYTQNSTVTHLSNVNKSVIITLGRKCTLATSRAAAWRVTLSMRRAPCQG